MKNSAQLSRSSFMLAAALLITILTVLALLHIYWALGGRLGRDVAIPRVGGKRTFEPGKAGTLLVAALLLFAAVLVALESGLLKAEGGKSAVHWGVRLIGIAFLLRAVGDFKLVGIFKKVHGTPFARWDNRLFSPLCLLISGLAFLVSRR